MPHNFATRMTPNGAVITRRAAPPPAPPPALANEAEMNARGINLELAQERLVQLKIEQAAVQEFVDAEDRKAVQSARIYKAIRELQVSAVMLNDIRRIHEGLYAFTEPTKDYADLRNELKEVAAEWGYKIVLVGDKSRGSLVKV